MEFSEVLRRRRMVRRFDNTPVSDEVLERIVDAGTRAPSAGNTRGQRFVVVTDRRTIDAIARLAGEDDYIERGFEPWLSTAAAHIVVATEPSEYRNRYREPDKSVDVDESWPVPYWWVDAGASMMAILLAAVDEGLGAGFLGTHAVPTLDELLGIPSSVHVVGVITIGSPAPDRHARSLDRTGPARSTIVHENHW